MATLQPINQSTMGKQMGAVFAAGNFPVIPTAEGYTANLAEAVYVGFLPQPHLSTQNELSRLHAGVEKGLTGTAPDALAILDGTQDPRKDAFIPERFWLKGVAARAYDLIGRNRTRYDTVAEAKGFREVAEHFETTSRDFGGEASRLRLVCAYEAFMISGLVYADIDSVDILDASLNAFKSAVGVAKKLAGADLFRAVAYECAANVTTRQERLARSYEGGKEGLLKRLSKWVEDNSDIATPDYYCGMQRACLENAAGAWFAVAKANKDRPERLEASIQRAAMNSYHAGVGHMLGDVYAFMGANHADKVRAEEYLKRAGWARAYLAKTSDEWSQVCKGLSLFLRDCGTDFAEKKQPEKMIEAANYYSRILSADEGGTDGYVYAAFRDRRDGQIVPADQRKLANCIAKVLLFRIAARRNGEQDLLQQFLQADFAEQEKLAGLFAKYIIEYVTVGDSETPVKKNARNEIFVSYDTIVKKAEEYLAFRDL